MKIKIDENLPIDCAELLRKANHDAVTVIEENLKGSKDQLIVEICSNDKKA